MKRICLIFTMALGMTGCMSRRAAVKHGEEMFKLGVSTGRMEESIECLSRILKAAK